MSSHDDSIDHIVPAKVFVTVWLVLLCLTAITVGAASLHMEKWSRFTAMLIASVKASLVVLYFMHVRYEKKIMPIIILVTIGTFGVFLILTFTDYPFR